jgi:plasmid stability protein
MATLHVENVPDDLYRALRGRARKRQRSIPAEILSLLADHVPTAKELRARRELLRTLEQARLKTSSRGVYGTTEEMQRQDRSR